MKKEGSKEGSAWREARVGRRREERRAQEQECRRRWRIKGESRTAGGLASSRSACLSLSLSLPRLPQPVSRDSTTGEREPGMGGRQSSPAGASRLSASNSPPAVYSSEAEETARVSSGNVRATGSVSVADVRPRTRSLSNVLQPPSSSNGHHVVHHMPHHSHHHPHLQPSLMSMAGLSFGLSSGSPDSDTSAEDGPPFARVISAHSLPLQPFLPFNGESCSPSPLPLPLTLDATQESSALSAPRPSSPMTSSAIWSCV